MRQLVPHHAVGSVSAGTQVLFLCATWAPVFVLEFLLSDVASRLLLVSRVLQAGHLRVRLDKHRRD